jgi:hypothetical protein
MNGATLNIHGMARIAETPTVKKIGSSEYYQVRLAQYPTEATRRELEFIWAELKAREAQKQPQKGDIIHIASGTYGVHKVQRDDGDIRRYHTLTAYVWRICNTVSAATAEERPAPAPAAVTAPSAATPPPEVPDDEDIPF